MAVKHAKTSAKADGTDATKVQPSDWNASHTIENDTVTEEMIALSNVTTNNSSTAKHGFLPKLSGNSQQYLGGDGAWAAVATSVADYSITNAKISPTAEIAVSKLGDGAPYQTLRTDSTGAIVEWGYKIYVGTSAPSVPVENDIWIDTTA